MSPPPPPPLPPPRIRKGDVKLGEDVARRQGHVLQIGDIPGREDDAAIVGIVSQFPHNLLELIDALAGVIGVTVGIFGAEVAPLEAVDGAEIAFFAVWEAEFVEVGA